MNTGDRFNLAHASRSPTIMVPPSPSQSVTKMATQLNAQRQDDKDDTRGAVTPASIRASMPPVRDVEFELLKKFQSELFQVIVKNKSQGLFHAEFTITSRDIDEYTLDFLFTKLVSILRLQRFFVALGSNLPRSFVVSWDPILAKDSITDAERNDPNSIAMIRTRRFARMQRKHQALAQDEQETTRKFQEYLQIMNQNPTATSVAPTLSQQQSYSQKQQQQPQQQQVYDNSAARHEKHSLHIDEKAKARSLILNDMLTLSRFQTTPVSILEPFSVGTAHPLSQQPNSTATRDTLDMIRAADQVAGGAVVEDDDVPVCVDEEFIHQDMDPLAAAAETTETTTENHE